jgi:hypothetical protein
MCRRLLSTVHFLLEIGRAVRPEQVLQILLGNVTLHTSTVVTAGLLLTQRMLERRNVELVETWNCMLHAT